MHSTFSKELLKLAGDLWNMDLVMSNLRIVCL